MNTLFMDIIKLKLTDFYGSAFEAEIIEGLGIFWIVYP